mmetsp:Transcript_2056/g.5974  ORF Transcript_2056/g.5974 Transcript_2056/m.5974 type:complete len:341 (-) Transcript_2056:594-1616(-)
MAVERRLLHCRLHYCRTFIDTDTAVPDIDLCAPRRSLRARTLPVEPTASDSSSIFDDERAYISNLSDRLDSLWELTAMSPEPDFGSAAVKTFFGHEGIIRRRDEHCDQELLSQEHGDRSRFGGDSGHEQDGKRPREEAFSTNASSTDTRSLVGEGAATGSAKAGEGASEGAACAPGVENRGSTGHPHLCSRPCLYFASGQCANGRSCNFCHAPHSKRLAHLDKKHREALRALPAAKAKALVFPVLQEKAVAFDSSPSTLRALDALARACEVAPGGASAVKSRSDRSLVVALTAVSLRVVLAALHRVAAEEEPWTESVVEAFVEHLRSVAVGRQGASAADA